MDWIDHIKADDEYHDQRFPKFWLMDDHRWGFYAWETSARETKLRERYSLIHLDYHYDGCNDFEEENEIAKLRKTSELSELPARPAAARRRRGSATDRPESDRQALASTASFRTVFQFRPVP